MSKEEVRPLRYGALHSATGCFARGSFAEHPEAEPRDMPPIPPRGDRSNPASQGMNGPALISNGNDPYRSSSRLALGRSLAIARGD